MSRITSLSDWILRLPLVWGGIACLGFYATLSQGWIESEFVTRYFASHPVEYIATGLFFVGLASLSMRLLGVAGQFASVQRTLLPSIPPGGQPPSDAGKLLDELQLLPEFMQQSYLVRRLSDALEYVRRKDSADAIDSYMRHLEEADVARMLGGYALVRIIVWAIPILGFLGTVIGITLAIAKLSPEALENSLPEVTSGLGVAFDTTALALALSMVLMFGKFCVERIEEHLLSIVDARTCSELVGRFHQAGTGTDPQVASVRRMSEQVLEAVEGLAARQAQIWKSTIDETHQQWADVTATTGQILESTLSTAVRENCQHHAQVLNEGAQKHVDQLNEGAQKHVDQLNEGAHTTVSRLREGLEKLAELLVEALEKHGESLARNEEELAKENRRHLSEVEVALSESMVLAADRQEKLIQQSELLLKEVQQALVASSQATVEQQQQLMQQGDVLLKVVEAAGQVTCLEEALNQNLASLGRAHDFEEVMLNLSAAIQLLGAKLGRLTPNGSVPIHLDEPASSAA